MIASGGRWRTLALLLLWVLSLAFQLRVLDEKFLLGDEGIALMGGWRISQGEIPHRDFFEIVPPLSFLPTAAVFKLFGVGILQARLLVLAYSLLLLLLVDRLLVRLGVSTVGRAFALALLTPFGVFYWPVPSHHWVADLLLLGALLALLQAVEAPAGARRAGLAAAGAGALTALCGLTLQDQGGYLLLATALLVLPWLPAAGGVRRRLVLAWSGGAAAVAGAAAALLLPLAGASELLYQWVLFPATRYKNITTNATRLLAGWDSVLGLWTSGGLASQPLLVLGLTLSTGVLFLLPPAAAVALVWLWRREPDHRLRTGVLAAGALACAGAAAHRWALTNIVWAAPGLLLPAIWALDRPRSAPGARSLPWGRYLLGAGGAGALLFGAAYYGGTARAALPRLQTPAGSLRSVRQEEVAAAQQAVDAIRQALPDRAPLFCTGYTPLLNFLTLHPNPTRYQFFFQPGYHTDAQAAEVVASLRATPQAWVLMAKPVQPALPVEGFVVANYDPVWQNGRAVLFRPRGPRP